MAAVSAPPVDLIFLLSRAAHALQTEMTAALEQINATPRAYCVLGNARKGEYTQKELADLCALDKTTMVVTMDALEKDGLAERRSSPTDRRARIIAVTPAGEEVVERGEQIVSALYADVLGSLPEDQREALVGALQTLMNGRLAEPAECSATVRRPRSS
ncbi:MarR family winged helix-turn-helix transcriptional regulator [Solirubrobacter deserti]|uniref:MarR family transcriptional regulator n=1 Tax=Solirubrobacter deserti TaxID=2282478 RepID=A0ABT4RSI2_9ACTN|nr:MarR family transcriptional regulator [Solirubrobacter deserti]MDA0141551.1 MarR family transcriptional regulator [Solirubrobacter deserti]